MSMLNLQIHLLWANSQQHECGIKQNKLSESVLPSVMLGWATTFVCTYVYVCMYNAHTTGYACMSLWIRSVFFQTHLDICVCKFMNKKWFSGLTVSRWPQVDGMYRLGHLFSYKWGVHCWFCVCSSAAWSFIRKYFSQQWHFHKKHTNLVYVFLYGTSRLS